MPLPDPADLSKFKSVPLQARSSMEDLLPEGKKKEPTKVFQGKDMRESASFLSKLFFAYPKPLIDAATKEKITFEQYGIITEDLKIKYEMEALGGHLDHYLKKDPSDKQAVLKAVVARNKINFFLSTLGKLVQTLIDLYVVTLIQ